VNSEHITSHPLQPRAALTTTEVARILRLHPVYARRLFTHGQIPGAVRIGAKWILPAEALDKILSEGLPINLPRSGGAR
jgi:excisionase family DNA binding protein